MITTRMFSVHLIIYSDSINTYSHHVIRVGRAVDPEGLRVNERLQKMRQKISMLIVIKSSVSSWWGDRALSHPMI